MDIAYDHIQEEALTPEEAARKTAQDEKQRQQNLNTELQEAYKSFTSSPWGARLGGFFNDVKKQGSTFYDEARQEASVAGGEAFKGFAGLKDTLVGHARSMSGGTNETTSEATVVGGEEGDTEAREGKQRSTSEALQENDSVIKRFRSEATKRLKELEKAEEAADAAIFKFGANIGNFLKDAVTIAPPTEEQSKSGKVLFESKDQDGKRVIHSTRFEAQLHAIHASSDSFTKDPASSEFEKWQADFDVAQKTDAIAKDLEKYEELRRTMEKLVPEKVDYPTFWTRYYFLRIIVETEEERRREILKGAAQTSTDDSISWDDESDSENDGRSSSTPQQKPLQNPRATISTTTLKPVENEADEDTTGSNSAAAGTNAPTSSSNNTATAASPSNTLKPAESRRSQDQHSQPDSDASYDLVSGATSRTPGSPKTKGADDEEEEDWE